MKMEVQPHMFKFLKILRIELEDLIEHVKALETLYEEFQEKHKETEHVCLENIALLKNEERSVNQFIRILDDVDPASYIGITEMAEDIRNKFLAKIASTGLAEAAFIFAEHKLERVLQYVQHA